MNIDNLEIKGKVCSKCGVWKPLEEYHKRKDGKYGRRSACKECIKRYSKQYNKDNAEKIKEHARQYNKNNKEHRKQYYKDNAERYKQYRKDNAEKIKEYGKQYRKDNAEKRREYNKQYYKDNTEKKKQYRKDNAEHYKQHSKQRYKSVKENNLQYVFNMIEQTRPVFKQLNLPIYGYIYKFENMKTGRVYIGQTIQPLKYRYCGGIIKGWIKERKEHESQKFTDELILNDFIVTEILDIGICKYHLDKLEVYYINKYDSYNNGYNNENGNHNTDDGIEEFKEILQQHNLEFINGQIVKKAI